MSATKTAKPRGRPRSFDTDAAIDAAMKLFHSRGYDAMRMAELGEELGLTPPSLYAAFGSKAGLFERALERYQHGEWNIFAKARGGRVVEVIDRMFAHAASLYPEHDGVAGCLVFDGASNSGDRAACALTAAAKQANRAAIRDFIASEYPDRADDLADFVTIAMAGMSAAARDGADQKTLGAFARNASRAFRHEVGLG